MIQGKVQTIKRLVDELYADKDLPDRDMKGILTELKIHVQDKIDQMPKSKPMNAQGDAEEMTRKLADSA